MGGSEEFMKIGRRSLFKDQKYRDFTSTPLDQGEDTFTEVSDFHVKQR